MSADLNGWSDTGVVGAILGFGVFGLAYLFTVIAIFMSISQSGKDYDEMIEHDK